MTGLLPQQSDTAPVRGEEKNCRMENIEPIRPKKKKTHIDIIALATLILDTKPTCSRPTSLLGLLKTHNEM